MDKDQSAEKTRKAQPVIRRSWWNRFVPLQVRLHRRLIFGSVLVLLVTGFTLGSFRINPIVFTQESQEQTSNSRFNIPGAVDFFDLNVPHNITLTIPDTSYEIMMNDFRRLGMKTWVPADIIIDGTLIENVGVRLKGNSTLRELGRDGWSWGGNGRMSNATFDNPATLPLLVSFDEYEDDLAYQGREELAIRPAQTGGTNLHEALALQLIADSGQVSQDFTWVTFSVNGYPSATRLVIENPDKRYAESIGLGSGVLYKSRSENRFVYFGEDQENYERDFNQINARKTHDLMPVIDLLKWLDDVAVEDFASELPEWVDIPSFARYVATQEILQNYDDMSGPGHNFLLWYDLADEKFTVISWDMNLALGGGDFRGGFGYRAGNYLKERFIRSEEFTDEIQAARDELTALWSDRNHANRMLEQLLLAVPVSDTLTEQQILRDSAQTRRSVQFIR